MQKVDGEVVRVRKILDYVISHELAHLKEMNHSRQFRIEVSKIDKNYKEHDKWLKENA